ncbi:hypothetical protein EJ07DRAFT_156518 [Lizonia empirigonia]|nr:hypothetical protein EJ07DRAFT_156518 [Lizonia empirigonia]
MPPTRIRMSDILCTSSTAQTSSTAGSGQGQSARKRKRNCGGGGEGMRACSSPEHLTQAHTTQSSAQPSAQSGVRPRAHGIHDVADARKRRQGEAREGEAREGTNHPHLYKPWLLLPPAPRRAIETRSALEAPGEERGEARGEGQGKGEGKEKGNVQVLVVSRNTSIKKGVRGVAGWMRRVRDGQEEVWEGQKCGNPGERKRDGQRQVGEGGNLAEERKNVLGQDKNETRERKNSSVDEVLAVSAQGSATVKLVGIVDMVLRGVGREGEGLGGEKAEGLNGEKAEGLNEEERGGKGKEGEEKKEKEGKQGVTWYVYVSLSSVHMLRSRGAVEDEVEDGDGDADANADTDADTDTNANANTDTASNHLEPANTFTPSNPNANSNPTLNPKPKSIPNTPKSIPNTKSNHKSNTGLVNTPRIEDTPRPIPVLTVWIARSRIAALGELVGERVVVW